MRQRIKLNCGHIATVDFKAGDRLTACRECRSTSVVRATTITTVKYTVLQPTLFDLPLEVKPTEPKSPPIESLRAKGGRGGVWTLNNSKDL